MKKIDHRKLGKELGLFHIDEGVGLGLPLWHPKGAILWKIVEDFWYQEHLKAGYELVRTPHIGSRFLWETSGHWGFYSDSMYSPMEAGQTLKDKQEGLKLKKKDSEEYLLKPMNCPFHIQIYKKNLKSYRDLPLRWAECGTVYRYEKKGELSGLTRVRGFTQDDAHIICRKNQVEVELEKVIDFIISIFKKFGFGTDLIKVYLSLRDPDNREKYIGTNKDWELTEGILRKVAKEKGLEIIEEKGGAAFYGPKLDFKLKDALDREWQCSTLQFDFNLPKKFEMNFINHRGEKETPYMLHRALFGSFERFIALLIEHYGGAFPAWLAPIQVKVIAVNKKQEDYCSQLIEDFRKKGIRAEVDLSSGSMGNRIRNLIKEKVPYLLVVGDKEVEKDMVSVRERGSSENKLMSRSDFMKIFK